VVLPFSLRKNGKFFEIPGAIIVRYATAHVFQSEIYFRSNDRIWNIYSCVRADYGIGKKI
jgi:hypothetical protein